MNKFLLYLSGFTGLLVLAFMLYMRAITPPHSQVFINGTVLTMDTDNRIVEAVAIKDNMIVATGSNAEISALINGDTVVHDLHGKTLVPGFIDAHGHFPGSGVFAVNADLRSPPMGTVNTISELQNRLSLRLDDKSPGEWLIGIGYDDTLLTENRHPNRADLDAVSSEHPIFIVHTSAHMGVANSLALELLGIDSKTVAPQGGVIVKDSRSGEPTGLLEETAMQPAMQQAMDLSPGELWTLLRAAVDEYASAGITTAQSGGMPMKMLNGVSMAAKLGLIPFRLELWPMYNAADSELFDALSDGSFDGSAYESALTHVNRVKIIADGSIQGFTGYLSQPYHSHFRGDAAYKGYPTVDRETLTQRVETLHRHGYNIAIHGNGDAAIDDILYAFEQAQARYPREDPRFIIIHAQMAREDQLQKMLHVGATPSFFSAHTYYWGERHRDIFMGPMRAARMSPTASAQTLGLKFSVHMDTPVAPMEPITLLWSTVNRLSTAGKTIGPAQRVSAMTALRAVTIDAAYQIFRDDTLGSIEVGKLADLVVLDSDPTTIPAADIRNIKVEQTMVGGLVIFDARD